jgi:deoxyribonuclease V
MNIPHKHDWNITPAEAITLQRQLVSEVIYDRPIDLNAVRFVAGVDVSVKLDASGTAMSQAAIAVLSFPDFTSVETALAHMPTPFPYIPGLLSFREGPVLEEAFKSLNHEPDVFIFDGMGRAHPRRIGIATHMGLWLQKPTIGCGKTLLTGHYREPADVRGAYSDLVDRSEVIGVVLRTRPGVKPVYISVGHLADLATSIELIMRCTTKYRLPEPIRAAHNAAGQFANL